MLRCRFPLSFPKPSVVSALCCDLAEANVADSSPETIMVPIIPMPKTFTEVTIRTIDVFWGKSTTFCTYFRILLFANAILRFSKLLEAWR